MKSTGIVRRIDELGRIVIPKELRRTIGIEVKDAIEIFIDGSTIILQKYERGCSCCSVTEKLIQIGNIHLCPNCVKAFEKVRKNEGK